MYQFKTEQYYTIRSRFSKAFLSLVEINNSTIYNMGWGDQWIRMAQTKLYLTDVTI